MAGDHFGTAVKMVRHLTDGVLDIVVTPTPLPGNLTTKPKFVVSSDKDGEHPRVDHLAGSLHCLSSCLDQLDSLTEGDGTSEDSSCQFPHREASYCHAILHSLWLTLMKELHGS